ncbi:hypothetical protein [Aquamicrobium ahrensii]|uniref:Helix-turn-helix domain-containing protein n=1 Tax=Aquamicrobium ahrensii TaxID=469551 RepID=A0ABV2KFZ3_9HYPH
MTAAAKKNPAHGSSRAQGDNIKGQSANYTQAQEAFKSLRSQPGFDERDFEAWESDRFCQQNGISGSELAEIIRNTRPKKATTRFEWLAAVTEAAGRGTVTLKGVLVANVLFQHFNDSSPYAWPSWKTIARLAGWSETNRQGVAEGLKQLSDIGAITRIAARDCPEAITAKILTPKTKGGSGRDARSVVFKRVDALEWKKGDVSMIHVHTCVREPETLNHKVQPQPATQGFLSSTTVPSSEAYKTAATSQIRDDGEDERRQAYG